MAPKCDCSFCVKVEYYQSREAKKENKMKFVITFTYKEEGMHKASSGAEVYYDPDYHYCFSSNRVAYDYYDTALQIARVLAKKNPDKLIYVTKVLSVSEYKPPVPVDEVVTRVLG